MPTLHELQTKRRGLDEEISRRLDQNRAQKLLSNLREASPLEWTVEENIPGHCRAEAEIPSAKDFDFNRDAGWVALPGTTKMSAFVVAMKEGIADKVTVRGKDLEVMLDFLADFGTAQPHPDMKYRSRELKAQRNNLEKSIARIESKG